MDKELTSLELGPAPPYAQGNYGPQPERQPSKLRACGIALISLLSLLSLIGFLLASYATQQVRTLKYPAVYLVADPKAVPDGYTVLPLGSGSGYWARQPDQRHGRSDHGVVGYGDSAYLIGGASNDTGSGSVLKSLVRYDTYTGFAYEMAPMPEPRQRFAYALLDGKIYVIGGVDSTNSNASALNSVMVYDIKTNTWNRTGNLNTSRSDACGGAATTVDGNGKVYVFGGYDSGAVSLATVEEYDPKTNTWTLLPAPSNLLVSRGDCRAAVVNNKIYAIGGVEFHQPKDYDCGGPDDAWVKCYRFLSSVEAFDPISKTFSNKAPMIRARGDFGIDARPDNRIIVAGGETGNGTKTQFAMNFVEEYIVDDDIWMEKAPLPEARFRADCANVKNVTFVFGGTPSCGLAPPGGSKVDCFNATLSTVFAYFGVSYPKLYTIYKIN